MRIVLISLMFAAVSLSGCATDGYREAGYSDYCRDCGVVRRIERVYGPGGSSGGGAVAGAIIGGVLGNQVGKGSGRKAATVAGAVAGGVIGNELEKDANEALRFEITVEMNDGRRRVYTQRDSFGLRPGDEIIAEARRVVPRR